VTKRLARSRQAVPQPIDVTLDDKGILEAARLIDLARPEQGQELMSPTYACGHSVPTMLNGSKAMRDLQYWRSVRFVCPECLHRNPRASAKGLGSGHLVGDGERDATNHCTMKHPCSYFCWCIRNEQRSLEVVAQERRARSRQLGEVH
jgi:hypothetical protein